MPRSRNRPRPPLPASQARGRRPRWQWRRVFGGLAEFLRSFAFVALGAPFVEPLLTGTPIDWLRAVLGGAFGFAFLAFALILDHERRD